MSAADLHAEALALIAEQRALIAAGTPGPWEWGVSADREWALIGSPEYSSQQLRSADDDDAALVVAAVNGYGPLLDLAEAVLLRHQPGTATDPEAREAMRAQIVETLGEHEYHLRVDGIAFCTPCRIWWQVDDPEGMYRAHLADVLLGLWDGDES